MRITFILAAAATFVAASAPVAAQQSNTDGLGEVVVTANRLNAPYAARNRPVVGLRRQADSAVMQVSVSSDSRNPDTRKREIHAVIASALKRAPAAGIELVTGNFELRPVTTANYKELPFVGAGRVDTSRAIIMIKTAMSGSAVAAEKKLKAFIKSIPKSGRGVTERPGKMTLTIKNPDQYRDEIVTLVAQDARHNTAIFGPDYAVQVTGIDGQISWSQISRTEVFLYIPYRYTIVPK